MICKCHFQVKKTILCSSKGVNFTLINRSPSAGYSVAVGEFTGDSEQGEKASNSLPLTTSSTGGIAH